MTRIAMVLTSHGSLGSTGRTTGFYLSEASHPHRVFTNAGMQVDFLSPAGGQPPVDGWNLDDPVNKAFVEDPVVAEQLKETLRPSQVDPSEYDAIFYVGGHGTMWDLPDDAALAGLAAGIFEAGGAIGAVCHGPAGLVNIRLSDGSFLVDGKPVSSFTDEEEAAAGLTEVVPFLLESKLRERGALHSKAANFELHTVVADRLVTGQNPASATAVAEHLVEVLLSAPSSAS